MKRIPLFGWAMLVACIPLSVYAEADGYGDNYGGSIGTQVETVSTAEDFRRLASSGSIMTIRVSGTIDLGAAGASIASFKTIVGASTSSTILGPLNVSGVQNVVIKYLNISNPAGDGITINNASSYVYVSHCTVYDCGDGCIDVTGASDYVTISYCRFYYQNVLVHKFANLIGAADTDIGDRGKLYVTMHHNWWDKNCDSRMPRVRFGRVHMYNNYFSSADNNYCSRPRVEAQLFSEYNYYEGVRDPLTVEDGGIAKAIGNVYVSCTNSTYGANDSVFRPTYQYRLESAQEAKDRVINRAGNVIPDSDVYLNKKETQISWMNPKSINYGTALTTTQLRAFVTGSTSRAVFNPPLGTVLPVGLNTLSVYIPEDSNYRPAGRTVKITVNAATTDLKTPTSIIKVYQDPVNQYVILEVPEQLLGAKMTMHSISGFLLKSAPLTQLKTKFDVASLPKGAYIFSIKTEKEHIVEKILKTY